jgi:hypothetical protein
LEEDGGWDGGSNTVAAESMAAKAGVTTTGPPVAAPSAYTFTSTGLPSSDDSEESVCNAITPPTEAPFLHHHFLQKTNFTLYTLSGVRLWRSDRGEVVEI